MTRRVVLDGSPGPVELPEAVAKQVVMAGQGQYEEVLLAQKSKSKPRKKRSKSK